MSADFSQFEDGDTVRVTLEGKWRDSGLSTPYLKLPGGQVLTQRSLSQAKRAELVEREVKSFHEGDVVLIYEAPRRRDADGRWRDAGGNLGATDDSQVRVRLDTGMYRPVVLHGKPVEKVEVRHG